MRPGRDISGVALPFVLQRRRSDPARDPCGSRASRRFALACLDRAIATARPAILVPQGAVRDEAGKKIVMVVRGDKAERRAVTLGATHGSDAEIVAGVVAGDQVIVHGPENLRDGQAVEVKK